MTYKALMVALDCETTGFMPAGRIVEIGLILYEDGKEVDRFCSLVHPGKDFNWDDPGVKKAMEINKIPVEAIDGRDPRIDVDEEGEEVIIAGIPRAPSFAEVYDRIPKRFWQAGAWVAHNAKFDSEMMRVECERIGKTFFPPLTICTQMLEAYLEPEVQGWKLVEVAARRGIKFEGEAHRADTDAKVCGEILMQMLPRLPDDDGQMATMMLEAQAAWQKKWGRGGYNHKPVVPSSPANSPEAKGVHHCHAYGCKTPVKPELLMCGPHWGMVPKDMQSRVWATYRKGQCDDKDPSVEWMEAADAAILAVAKAEGKDEYTIEGLERRWNRSRVTVVTKWLRSEEGQYFMKSNEPDPRQLSEGAQKEIYRLGYAAGAALAQPNKTRVRFQSYRDGYRDGHKSAMAAKHAYSPFPPPPDEADQEMSPRMSSSVTDRSTESESASTSAASLAFRAFRSLTFSSIVPSAISL